MGPQANIISNRGPGIGEVRNHIGNSLQFSWGLQHLNDHSSVTNSINRELAVNCVMHRYKTNFFQAAFAWLATKITETNQKCM